MDYKVKDFIEAIKKGELLEKKEDNVNEETLEEKAMSSKMFSDSELKQMADNITRLFIGDPKIAASRLQKIATSRSGKEATWDHPKGYNDMFDVVFKHIVDGLTKAQKEILSGKY